MFVSSLSSVFNRAFSGVVKPLRLLRSRGTAVKLYERCFWVLKIATGLRGQDS